ncbi:penicillin-binding protein 2 [Phocoenobacter skyensis]|uniref:Peptidoglycan D,D-transpeptidase MrdA n=1 Tax=Phocoenobacter skyensis TaxID=97481 RepID=A0A1H7ZLR1_9PAST|nr:penicillin-binding protein 2 [Pasteurella skyensis]MDP8078945.1 penicillin-binding protein 2 [Pasteurella skyensis]MDP8084895.1 penicillin-binding protein 2 [Pasteurella skyensis]MDP8169968.1 penicillin-binding protein 2 [Pasteurella skyensis]MDP8174096.1 penicillin-binding protein 2 [Pasteurella skyensis]MDP8186131.1 penicillin-binding protein 2 [Pasteurella skyensis]
MKKVFNQKHHFKSLENNSVRNSKAESNLFARRALVGFLGVLILTAVLLVNIYHLQVSDYKTYQTRSNGNRIKLLPVPPVRGLIYDRKGRVLAENLTYFGLYVVPEKVDNLEKTLEKLKEIVGLTDKDIEEFHKERRRASHYTPIFLKKNLTEEQIARFAVNQYLFPNIDVKPYFKRHYPYGESLTHIIGYVAKINDKDQKKLKEEGKYQQYAGMHNIGKRGIEKYYEDQLHGITGLEEVEINNRGKVIRKLREKTSVAGSSIQLTLDVDLQNYISNLLEDKKGAVVVLDARDSSILAMVTKPSYNNNLFVDGISYDNYTKLLNNPNRPLYSRATQGAYPPASTIKPFMAVAGLTEGVITPQMTIFDPGYWVVPNTSRKFRDWKRVGHGHTNLNKAIAESSDTYFYQLAFNLGIDKVSKWMKKFGFGMQTGIDIFEESSAIMPSREWKQKRYKQSWLQGDTVSIGIGQGYWIATPLQLAKALAVLVNNGKVNTPHLMKEIVGEKMQSYQDPKLYDDIKNVPKHFWKEAKQGMYSVTNALNGTARKAFLDTPYHIAGKSGTAQVFSLAENQEYDAKELKKELHDHALFISFAPYEDPKVIISIILENAGGGSSNAAPVVRKIMDYILLNSDIFKNMQYIENQPLKQEERQ